LTKPTNIWRTNVASFPLLKAVSSLRPSELVTYALLAFAIYVGAGSAYVLGVLFGLPSVIITSINHATIAHLFGQITFLAIMAVSLFKVSQLFVRGILFQSNFTICKFYYGPKRPRGLRHPAVARLQRRMNSSVVEGRSFGKTALVTRIFLTLAFLIFVFFPIQNSEVPTSILSLSTLFVVIPLSLIAVFGSLSAYRVAAGRTHRDFFASFEGKSFAVLAILWFCLLVGMARSFSMMHGSALSYAFEGKVCSLAPMMPIFVGELFFDQDSKNFVIMSDGRISFFIPHFSARHAPSCI
jgi:hypothetical protein